MDGQTVLLTGATSGLGRSGALSFADLGAYVIGVGRNPKELSELERELAGRGEAWTCDLSDLVQARELANRASELTQLDVVVHNAGALSREFRLTPQGNELTLAVHVLSPYLITRHLNNVATAPPSRTVFMTSGGMYAEKFDLATLEMNGDNYRGSVAYARAKRAQVVLCAALTASSPSPDVRYYCVHPGWAKTPGVAESLPVFNAVTGALLRSASQGFDGALWLASTKPPPTGGQLWLDRQIRPVHRMRRTRSNNEHGDQSDLIAWLNERVA